MTVKQSLSKVPKVGLLILAYIAFIALGMPDGLLGVAWPSIRSSFNVSLDAVGILMPISVAGYMTSSFSSGPLIQKFGVGKILVISCVLTGTALISYTLVPAFWMMAVLGVLGGLGAGAIDAGLNNYVEAHYNESLMQWLHASYGVGITCGPVIMTIALSTWNSWHIGYRIVGGFQFVMAIAFLLTLSMWAKGRPLSEGTAAEVKPAVRVPMRATMKKPRAWLSAALFFTYVGAEVSFGTWTYSLLVESRHVNPEMAGIVAGSYWATFTIGRIIAGLYAKRVGVHTLVQCSLAAAIIGAGLLLWNPAEWANLLAVAIIGLAIAPIFPAFISGTSRRVGEAHTGNTIGMQMAASGLGTAVIPSLLGVLAVKFSLEVMPLCMVIDFLILFMLYRISMKTIPASEVVA